MKIFAERLRYERKILGYTQNTIAAKLGIPQSTYKSYELVGKKNGREPSIEMINKIAKLLDVSVDYLFGNID